MKQQFLQRCFLATSALLGFTALTAGNAQAASFSFDQSKLTLNSGSTPVNFNITMDDEAAGAGKVQLKFDVSAGSFADLRGLFLHVKDESILDGLKVEGNYITQFVKQANSVLDLGGGSNVNGSAGGGGGKNGGKDNKGGGKTDTETSTGLITGNGGFDIGIEVGTQGIGKDDVRSVLYTFSHSSRALSLTDFSEQMFGVRMMSVGTSANSREGSSKLVGNTPLPPVVIPPKNEEPPVEEPPIDDPNEPIVPPVAVDPTPPKEEKPVEVPEPSMVLLSLASLGALKLVKRRQPEASVS